MNPWIQNIALADVASGFHIDAGINAMLIQIVDPAMEFPKPKHEFREIHQFEFLDLERDDMPDAEEFKITDEQAATIAELLKTAFDRKMNVIVHCVAGVCRSGAVAEVGVMMGFRDTEAYRQPNLLVKHKLMKHLGWTYSEDEPPTINGKEFQFTESGIIHVDSTTPD